MDKQINILILEDNPSDAELVQRELRKAGLDFEAQLAQDKEAFIAALDKFIPDLVLADFSLPGFSGMGALIVARERFKDIPVIIVSGAIGEEVAIETLKAGATDYVLKQRLGRLGSVVRHALQEAEQLADKKKAEEALRQSDERLRLLIESVKDYAIVQLDTQGRVTAWNSGAKLTKGYDALEIMGKHFSIFYTPEDVQNGKPQKELDTVIRQGRFSEEGWRVRKGGQRFWASVTIGAMRDSTGKLDGFVKITRDMTEHKRAEETLRENEERLRNQTKELETIIGIVSHDLRAPLMNVRGFNKFLKKDCDKIQKLLSEVNVPANVQKQFDSILKESMCEATGFIDTSAAAMNNLVESLVAVARAGLVVPKPETLDMNMLIKNVVDSIRIKFKDAGATIDVDDLPPCFADRMHVTQIFTNLIDNAVKYLDHGRRGEICVCGRVENNHVLYWVADNGIGIAPQHAQKVFDIYYRISEKAAVSGEGIGLSMAKRMVERNSGRMWLVSDKDKGSNFFVALPLPSSK